jgi:zona occludens toxin
MGGAAITRFSRDKQFSTDYQGDLEKCSTKVIKRDSNFYGVYWSADDHTAKFKLPPKLMLVLLAIPLFIYVFYSLLVSLGITGDEPEIKEETPVITKTAQPIKTTKKIDNLTFKPKSFTHPLNEMCVDYEYGGYQLKRVGAVLEVEHFINCVTGQEVEKEQAISFTTEDGQEQSRTEQIKEPETILLNSNYLEKLGYFVYLSDDLPILKFEDKNIYLHQF